MGITHIGQKVRLNNGLLMPWLGLGVFQMTGPSEAEQAVLWALEIGYRSLDTAAVYGNEEGVGRGLRQSGLQRDQVFLTTKVWNSDLRRGRVRQAFEDSLRKLGTDYVDLYLIHWPVTGAYRDAWEVLRNLQSQGRIRAIGVSNFMEEHLEDLFDASDIIPAVNQIEFHPRLIQSELLDYCRNRKIQVEAWSPLMQGGVFQIPKIAQVAERYGKSVAQVVLRWNLQKGVVTIPKSSRKDRIRENAEIFDFSLDKQDMDILDAMDRGERVGPDPRNFSF